MHIRKKIKWENVDSTYFARNMDQFRAFVITVMKHLVPQKTGVLESLGDY